MSAGRYVYVWEYYVKAGCKAEFEKAYGATGDWVRLFERGQGYVSTELIRDTKTSSRYLTIDTWASEADFVRFRAQHAAGFEALDRACEALMERETPLGAFLTVTPAGKTQAQNRTRPKQFPTSRILSGRHR